MVDKKQDIKLNQLFSLRNTCKQRLKSTFQQLRKENRDVQSFLMVVDQKSLKMISSFMKQMELLELDILAVELLENSRKSYQNQHAIYIITPTDESVNKLLEDFESKKEYQYGVAHLLLTNKISKELMLKIANCKVLIERLKTFKEFNQDFSCKFDNLFNLDMPEALPVIYSQQNDKILYQQMIGRISGKLATVITSLEKFYAIEIIYNQNDNKISQNIAVAVQQRLEEITVNIEKSNTSDVFDPNSGKVTLLIVDRSIDPTSPLVRDFYYQPMMYDLLDVENDIVNYQNETNDGKFVPTKAKLEDNDDLFSRYRYKHIAEVMDGIPSEFRDFCNNNATAKLQQGDLADLDLDKMSQVIKTMPQYKELLKKYNMHIKLIQDCWKIFGEKDLSEIGELEQTIVTGLNDAGKSVSASTLMKKIGARLDSNNLTSIDKLRLVLITIICLEMVEKGKKTIQLQIKDRKALTDKIQIEDQRAIINLIWLGITPQSASSKKSGKSKERIDKKVKQAALTKLQSSTMSLSRNTTVIESLLEELVANNSLDQVFRKLPAKFGSIQMYTDQLSSKQGATSYKKKTKLAVMIGQEDEQEMSNQIPKLIVFVAGGISQNEVRALRNLECLKETVCVVGGSSFLKPNDFVQGLIQMHDNL